MHLNSLIDQNPKKIVIRLSVFIILILAFSTCKDITDSIEDLGTLEPAVFVSSQAYCRHELTEVSGEQPAQFIVGDIICIECCAGNEPPWPKKVSVNNNCQKTITFGVADGKGCSINAKRLGQTCTSCDPGEANSVLKCPNS